MSKIKTQYPTSLSVLLQPEDWQKLSKLCEKLDRNQTWVGRRAIQKLYDQEFPADTNPALEQTA